MSCLILKPAHVNNTSRSVANDRNLHVAETSMDGNTISKILIHVLGKYDELVKCTIYFI